MNFSFQDLMAFGLLIVALLTAIFDNRKQCFSLKTWKQAQKNHPCKLGSREGGVSIFNIRSTPCGWLFLMYIIYHDWT